MPCIFYDWHNFIFLFENSFIAWSVMSLSDGRQLHLEAIYLFIHLFIAILFNIAYLFQALNLFIAQFMIAGHFLFYGSLLS